MAIFSGNSSRSFPRRCLPATLVTSLLFNAAITALPQTQSATAQHPKIGLVLEGGGALGLAHIGVLKYLEEHHIPVNYVAGTSMGGLIGGVYATGRSAPEVEQLVQSIQWNNLLRGQVPFKNLNYRRKEDSTEYPGAIEFGIKKGIQFPEGFNTGQEVTFILDRVALPYSTIKHFDQLPVPFACVGTDLVQSKQYVFRDGSLSTALRSTMSLPGVFTPVREDGHIFADGGLLDNLPVDVAKSMGADVVVAVHLETEQMKPTAAMSSFGVLGRSISVVIAVNEMKSMEQADVLITVPVDKYSTMDYLQGPALITAGYQAAQSKGAILSRFSVDDATWANYLAEKASRRLQTPVPQFVQVTGTDPESAKAIEKQVSPSIDKKPVDVATIQNQILNVQGDGRYSSLSYSMTEQNGQPGLLIQAEEKPYAPPIIRPFILIDGSDTSNVLFTLGGRITFMNVGHYGAEWRNDIAIGAQYGIDSEYYLPFHAGSNWFIAPHVLADSEEFNAFASSGYLAAIYRQRQAGGGFDIGYQLGRGSEFRIGYQAVHERYSTQVGAAVTEPEISGAEAYTGFQYNLLHTDDSVVPTTGQRASFRTQWFNAYPDTLKGLPISLGSEQHFPLTEGRLTHFHPFNDRTSIFFTGGGGTTYNANNISFPVFRLGGPSNFAAYGNNEILTDEYFLGQVGFLRELKELPPLLGNKLYFQGRFEIGEFKQIGNEFGEPANYRVPGDLAGGVIVNTIFGPVLLGGAVGDAGHKRFFFALGRVF